jgi:hypothetical protein
MLFAFVYFVSVVVKKTYFRNSSEISSSFRLIT